MTSSSNPLGLTDEQIHILMTGYIFNTELRLKKHTGWFNFGPNNLAKDPPSNDVIDLYHRGWLDMTLEITENPYWCGYLTETGLMVASLVVNQ